LSVKKSQDERIKELLDQGFSHDQVLDLVKAGKLDDNSIDFDGKFRILDKYFKVISNWVLSHKKPVIGVLLIILIVGVGYSYVDSMIEPDNPGNSTKMIKNNDIRIDNVATTDFSVDPVPDSLSNQYYTYKMNFDLTPGKDYNNVSIQYRFKDVNGSSIGNSGYARMITGKWNNGYLNLSKDSTVTYEGSLWGNINRMGTVAPSKVLLTVIDNANSKTLFRQEFSIS
jgi:hypothetical protein